MRWPTPFAADRWESRTRTKGQRLVEAWGNFLGRYPWQWFVTLTFDREHVSRELASRETFWWIGLVGHLERQPMVWVYAVERQPDGRHHSHTLISDLHQPDWRAAKQAWRARNGKQINIQSVTASKRLALYQSKSVASDGEVVLSDTILGKRQDLTEHPTVDLFSR